MSVKIDDKGTIAKVAKALRSIGSEINPKFEKMLGEEIKSAYDHARRIVPVRTGFLRSTIYYAKLKAMTFVLGVKAPYAQYVEYGTSRMDARPFMRPAWSRFMAELYDLTLKLLREIARKS